MKYLLLFPLAVVLSACGTTGGGGDSGGSAPKLEWPKSTGTVKISNTVSIRSMKDYGYKIVDGSGLSGDGGQGENQEAPFDIFKGGIKRVIAKNWPESLHVRGDNIILENIYIPNVGEDAITIFAGSRNVIIRNIQCEGAEDKIIQINGGNEILIKDSKFKEFKSAIRITSKETKRVEVTGCTFINGTGAMVINSGIPEPKQSGNTFYNVKHKVRKG